MKTATKLLGGAAAAAAMGVAAGIFLNSKKGRALTQNAKETLADFYQHVAPQLKKLGDMGKEEYQVFMETAAEKYAKAKKLSKETLKILKSEAKHSWQEFSENLE